MLSRTFTADPYMKDLMERYVHGRYAFVTIVHNSHDINDVFAKFVAKDDADDQVRGLIRNLRFAKHRLATVQKSGQVHW